MIVMKCSIRHLLQAADYILTAHHFETLMTWMKAFLLLDFVDFSAAILSPGPSTYVSSSHLKEHPQRVTYERPCKLLFLSRSWTPLYSHR